LGAICSAFIHRSCCRVHNICTLTGFSIFQTTVLASAYPRHYPRPLLLEESLPSIACGLVACSVAWGSGSESAGWVTSFRLFVWRIRRAKLSTGFCGCEPWSASHPPGPYPLPFWSSLLVHVGLSPITMVQFVRVPTHRYLLAGVAQLDSELTRFSSRFTD
jgi:hypothetical protein